MEMGDGMGSFKSATERLGAAEGDNNAAAAEADDAAGAAAEGTEAAKHLMKFQYETSKSPFAVSIRDYLMGQQSFDDHSEADLRT